MKLANLDWSILRNASILLAFSAVIGGGMITASTTYRASMEKDYTKHHRRYLDMSGKYLTVDEEERTIKSYYPLYQSLEREGIIGEEQRLDWIDTLRAAAIDIKLPSLRYEIASRTAYQPDYPIDTGIYKLYASKISLKLGLFHEGDLINMLDALSSNSPGIFSVDDCRMIRRGERLQRSPTSANIAADCELSWITLKPENPL